MISIPSKPTIAYRPFREPSDLQTQYQRGLLYGIIGATLIGFVITVWLSMLDGSAQNVVTPIIENLIVVDSTLIVHANDPARNSVGRFLPNNYKHLGFVGINGYTIIREDKELDVSFERPAIALLPEIPEFDPGDVSFSVNDGDDIGVFIPDGSEFTFSHQIDFPTKPEAVSKAHILCAVSLDSIVHPEYPLIADIDNRDGFVIAVVCINQDGTFSRFPEGVTSVNVPIQSLTYEAEDGQKNTIDYAIVEEPKGYYFAEKLLEVLPLWKIRLEDIGYGIPERSLVVLRYDYSENSQVSVLRSKI